MVVHAHNAVYQFKRSLTQHVLRVKLLKQRIHHRKGTSPVSSQQPVWDLDRPNTLGWWETIEYAWHWS